MSDPQLDQAIALAREVLHRTGALRVSVALDRPQPAIVECERLRAVVVRDAAGERTLPHDAAIDAELPELPLMAQLPPFSADPETGEISGALGGLEMLGRAVREVAGLMGARSVVAADFETDDPERPLGIAGRAGEPVVVLVGDDEFELDV
jgi:hypothetical protein